MERLELAVTLIDRGQDMVHRVGVSGWMNVYNDLLDVVYDMYKYLEAIGNDQMTYEDEQIEMLYGILNGDDLINNR